MPERRVAFAVPGALDTPTGGYAYDRRIMAELGWRGWDVQHIALSGQFPAPDPHALVESYARLAAVPDGVTIVIDGLALGAMPEIRRHLRPSQAMVALVHHPLALESGLSPARAATLRDSERAALAAARHVIANSPATARALVADYGIAESRLTIAPPGTDPAPRPTRRANAVPILLSVGILVPRKGHDVLIAALATLKGLPWRLTIVGNDALDPPTTQALTAQIGAAGLEDRVALAGTCSAIELEQHYAAADLFVLASRHEGYGMAYAEAIAHGLPVVGTTAGAIPDVVPALAGRLVPPDDAPALAAALQSLIADADARTACARAARAAADRLPRWADSADLFARALVVATA